MISHTEIPVNELAEEHLERKVDSISAAKLVAWPHYRLITPFFDEDIVTKERRPNGLSGATIHSFNHRKDGKTTIRLSRDGYKDANSFVCAPDAVIRLQVDPPTRPE